MAIVTVRVRPDRASYLRGGHDPSIDRIDVDLGAMTPEDRDLLATHSREDMSITSDGTHVITVAAPTPDAILAALRQIVAERAERAQHARDEAAEADKRVAERAATARARSEQVLRDRIIDPTTTYRSYGGTRPAWPYSAPADITDSPEARAWIAELRQQDQDAERSAAARVAAEIEALHQWAQEHGSERAQLLIEEHHQAWQTIAEDEYLTAATPAGYIALGGPHSDRERTKPTAADIHALRDARALVAADVRLSDPELRWIVYYRKATEEEVEHGDADDDGDVVVGKSPAVRLTVHTPTGASRDVYRDI